MGFSKDFIWGAATASYQIEGGAFEDGKGLSVWDRFTDTPGKIFRGHRADVACDSYHRLDEDMRVLKEIGVNAYRFSMSWPRLIPNGIGAVNIKGFDYYDRLIDELLKNNITPHVTLFHWDYPLELYYKGGWLNRDSIQWFAEYADKVIAHYSDRVADWITQNEPHCYIRAGHFDGAHAPGLRLPYKEYVRAWHHNLVAHGEAVKVIRANAKLKPSIGLVSCGEIAVPLTETPEDIAAAKYKMFERQAIGCEHWLDHSELMDPAVLGKYTPNLLPHLPENYENDMSTIAQPIDYIGMNIYSAYRVRKPRDGEWELVGNDVGFAETTMDWGVRPECLYWGAKFMHERYGLPIMITENGVADNDWIHLDGKVHDTARIDFINRYLKSYKRAADEGVPLKGFFYWSLLDNFEWSMGFSKRFGLTYVDFNTLERTVKDSGYHYREIIKTNGENL